MATPEWMKNETSNDQRATPDWTKNGIWNDQMAKPDWTKNEMSNDQMATPEWTQIVISNGQMATLLKKMKYQMNKRPNLIEENMISMDQVAWVWELLRLSIPFGVNYEYLQSHFQW